jgi:hypothetical protein
MEFEPLLCRKGTVEYGKNGNRDPSLNKGVGIYSMNKTSAENVPN